MGVAKRLQSKYEVVVKTTQSKINPIEDQTIDPLGDELAREQYADDVAMRHISEKVNRRVSKGSKVTPILLVSQPSGEQDIERDEIEREKKRKKKGKGKRKVDDVPSSSSSSSSSSFSSSDSE